MRFCSVLNDKENNKIPKKKIKHAPTNALTTVKIKILLI